MLVGAHSEVLNGLSGVLRSSDKKSVGSSRRPQRKLVKGKSFTSCSLDLGTSSGCESQGGDGELRNLEETVIVGDGTDNNDGLVVVVGSMRVRAVLDDARNGDRGPVDL